MPDMTGLELADAVETIRPSVPVIICTGFINVIQGEHLPSNRVYLSKPAEKQDLLAAIQRLKKREQAM